MQEQPKKEAHYNQEVWVNPTTEALRKLECLCLNCSSLKPGQPDNCPIAQSFYEICVKENVALAVTRCPLWKTNDLEVLLKKPTPQDVIAAIFAYSGLETFTNDRKKIQTFIHKNKKGKAAELLPFVFSQGVDPYPYSRLLENVLGGLFLGKIIFTQSPHYDNFHMSDKTRKEVLRKTEERFSPEQITILKGLGRRWRRFNATIRQI